MPTLILYRIDERFVAPGEVLSPEEKAWQSDKYSLDYSLANLSPLSEAAIPLSSGNFRIRGLFGLKAADRRVFDLQALRAAHGGKGWINSLTFGDDAVLDRLLVLCFPTSCDTFIGPGQPTKTDETAARPATEGPQEQDPVVSAINNKTRAIPKGMTAKAIADLTRLQLEYYNDGDKSWDPIISSAGAATKFKADGGLPCLLHAMDPDLFRLGDGITCGAERLDSWRERLKGSAIVFEKSSSNLPVSGAVARIHAGRREGAVSVPVARIEVEVPANGSDRGCRLSAIFETGTLEEPLQKTIGLTREDNGANVLFTADLDDGERPLVRSGAITVQIAVLGEAGCRLEDRSETLRANQATLKMHLTATGIEFRNLVYLPLFNSAGLDAEFSTTMDRRVLADAMIMAITSAHRRLSASIGDDDLQIRRAEVMLVEPEAIDIYAALDLVRLRNLSEVNETFRGADARKLQEFAGRLFAPDPNAISRLLGQHFSGDAISKQIVLIDMGHWIARDRTESLCDPLRLRALRDAVRTSTGKTVRILSFPLLRASPEQANLVAPQLDPQAFVPSRGQSFREVVACRGGDSDIAIYPFLAPDWYGVEEMAYRYGAAVGDQLGGVLNGLAVLSRKGSK